MARIHAFEFEDQTWFPGLVREYITDFLSHMGGFMPSATPGGVPVVTTSPGSSTMNCVM